MNPLLWDRSNTYDNFVGYIAVFPQLVPSFVRYRLVHQQMEGGWYTFCNDSELLHHR